MGKNGSRASDTLIIDECIVGTTPKIDKDIARNAVSRKDIQMFFYVLGCKTISQIATFY
jgi:hypothetical protein